MLTPSECESQPGSSRPGPDQLCAGLSHSHHTACPGQHQHHDTPCIPFVSWWLKVIVEEVWWWETGAVATGVSLEWSAQVRRCVSWSCWQCCIRCGGVWSDSSLVSQRIIIIVMDTRGGLQLRRMIKRELLCCILHFFVGFCYTFYDYLNEDDFYQLLLRKQL